MTPVIWMTIILMISSTLLGAIFFVLFRWAVRDGQFDDPEEAKYVIFREDERHANGGVNGGKE